MSKKSIYLVWRELYNRTTEN